MFFTMLFHGLLLLQNIWKVAVGFWNVFIRHRNFQPFRKFVRLLCQWVEVNVKVNSPSNIFDWIRFLSSTIIPIDFKLFLADFSISLLLPFCSVPYFERKTLNWTIQYYEDVRFFTDCRAKSYIELNVNQLNIDWLERNGEVRNIITAKITYSQS